MKLIIYYDVHSRDLSLICPELSNPIALAFVAHYLGHYKFRIDEIVEEEEQGEISSGGNYKRMEVEVGDGFETAFRIKQIYDIEVNKE